MGLYMQKKGMGPFAAGGKLAMYAQKGGAKTAAGGAKTSPMQSADPVEKNPAAAADAAAVATKDTAVAVEAPDNAVEMTSAVAIVDRRGSTGTDELQRKGQRKRQRGEADSWRTEIGSGIVEPRERERKRKRERGSLKVFFSSTAVEVVTAVEV